MNCNNRIFYFEREMHKKRFLLFFVKKISGTWFSVWKPSIAYSLCYIKWIISARLTIIGIVTMESRVEIITVSTA